MSSACGVNLDSRIADRIWYVIDKIDKLLYSLQCVLSPFL